MHEGLLGSLPKTILVIDYPLLERIDYALVAGFDVYGRSPPVHPAELHGPPARGGRELLLRFHAFIATPQEIMQSWYKGVDLKKIHYYPTALPEKISFVTADPRREFIEELVSSHFAPAARVGFDSDELSPGGRRLSPACRRSMDQGRLFAGFPALSKPGMPFLSLIDDYNANLAFLRIRMTDGKDVAGTSWSTDGTITWRICTGRTSGSIRPRTALNSFRS